VTLRHLLSHTAGFEEWLGDDGSQQSVAQPDLRVELTTDPPRQIFTPGTTPVYSNYGYTLAGYLVQRVSGQRFEQYVQAAILDPLGCPPARSSSRCLPGSPADWWPAFQARARQPNPSSGFRHPRVR
jgi:CubicO group peptidase (beta-lactamase class C family)